MSLRDPAILAGPPCENSLASLNVGEIEVSSELTAMFRNEGEDLPGEIADRLKELEKEAAQDPDDDSQDDGPCDGP